jgi:hypothetical protein
MLLVHNSSSYKDIVRFLSFLSRAYLRHFGFTNVNRSSIRTQQVLNGVPGNSTCVRSSVHSTWHVTHDPVADVIQRYTSNIELASQVTILMTAL